jgi:hypothetical protein
MLASNGWGATALLACVFIQNAVDDLLWRPTAAGTQQTLQPLLSLRILNFRDSICVSNRRGSRFI